VLAQFRSQEILEELPKPIELHHSFCIHRVLEQVCLEVPNVANLQVLLQDAE
jgi:hypothetical protein